MKYLFILICILLISCATTSFDINNVEFALENKQQKVLPLKYYNQSSMNSKNAEKLMKNILMLDGEYSGYYYIHHDFGKREEKMFLFDIGFIDGTVGIVLNLMGVPKSRMYYNLKARIYLFDANGNIAGIYEETDSFVKFKGLYYGNGLPAEEMVDRYKKMFNEIVNNIATDKERVNNLLELSGTLKNDSSAKVYTEVYRLINW